MATRGFLIRFIDIGLIVLFGFLMISDIEASSRVELGGATDEVDESVEDDQGQAFILVEVAADGSFVVGEAPSGRIASVGAGDPSADPSGGAEPGPGVTNGPAVVRVATAEALAEAVRSLRLLHQAAGLSSVILIEPHPASAVQRTVDAMDVADRLGMPKSLRMDIEVVRGAAPGSEEGRAP